MARGVNGRLTYDPAYQVDFFIVNAGSTTNLDISLQEVVAGQLLIETSFLTTSATTTGFTCTAFYGFGPGDPTAVGSLPCVLETSLTAVPPYVVFSSCGFSNLSGGDNIPLSTVPTNGTNTVVRTPIKLSDPVYDTPRWLRLQFTNNDPLYSGYIRIYYNIW